MAKLIETSHWLPLHGSPYPTWPQLTLIWIPHTTLAHIDEKVTLLSFHSNFSNCTDIQRMFHILSSKAMTKAHKKTEEIIQTSLKSCQSDDAWNEKKQQFYRCTAELKRSKGWIDQIYHTVEKLVAEEGKLFFGPARMSQFLWNHAQLIMYNLLCF